MSTRFDAGPLLDFQAAAAAIVSGNASGVTPMVSGWVRVIEVDSVAIALATATTTGGVWTAQLATGPQGQNAIAHPSPPTFPTGSNQSATVVLGIPSTHWKYFRLTFTPSTGSGAVTATPTVVTGRAVHVSKHRQVGVVFDCPATATLSGQASLQFSADKNDGTVGSLGNLPINTPEDPAIWFPATDDTDAIYTSIPALVTSTGQTFPLRLGNLEFEAIRAIFIISGGFGRYRVTFNAKG